MESSQATVRRPEFRLGEWVVQPSLNRVVRGDRSERLRPLVMDLLVLLADNAGRVISKDEIIDKVWGVRFVGDSALARSVAELRGLFGDDPDWQRVIETIPKRGYRLLAPVAVGRPEPEAAAFHSVAVLPFADLSRRGDQEYFCNGLAEELINSLTQVQGLRVVARTSAFAFKDKSMDVRDIGRQLNADAVLEGGLQKTGRRLRITVQLIDAREGYHLWSERFDRTVADIFALEDEIARAIVNKLRPQLAPDKPVVKAPTSDPEVHRLCLQGRFHYLKENAESTALACESFERAIARDANCAAAWAGLAACCWDGAQFGFINSPDELERGRRSAAKAVELDPALAEAHAILGVYRGAHDFDWSAAEREFAKAFDLGTVTPTVREHYAMYFLQPMLRLDEAVEQLRLALALDPLSPLLHAQLGHLHVLRREYDQACQEAQHAFALEPNHHAALGVLSMALTFQGKFDELAAAAATLPLDSMYRNAVVLGGMGWCLAMAGQEQQARAILAELQSVERFSRVNSWSVAWVHVGLGENDEALKWLGRAVEERDPKIVYLRTKPFWDPLRPDPRFRGLLRRMRLVD